MRIAGMVTVEDLIEEIVGDIRDEHDESPPDVVKIPGGHRVSGLLRIDEVADETGFRAPEGDYETIGGLVMAVLGHIPSEGESVELTAFDPDAPPDQPPRWRASVARMDGRRIDHVELVKITAPDNTGPNDVVGRP
jgi:CBS domain containing-hemolysin-like protein